VHVLVTAKAPCLSSFLECEAVNRLELGRMKIHSEACVSDGLRSHPLDRMQLMLFFSIRRRHMAHRLLMTYMLVYKGLPYAITDGRGFEGRNPATKFD
jgi:hypothetical protein